MLRSVKGKRLLTESATSASVKRNTRRKRPLVKPNSREERSKSMPEMSKSVLRRRGNSANIVKLKKLVRLKLLPSDSLKRKPKAKMMMQKPRTRREEKRTKTKLLLIRPRWIRSITRSQLQAWRLAVKFLKRPPPIRMMAPKIP